MGGRAGGALNRLDATIVLIAGTLFLHNLSPYFGLRDDSCQAMFSRLSYGDGTYNNHLFMPQNALWDGWRYYDADLTATVSPAPAGSLAVVEAWLTREGKRRNTRAVRVAVGKLCRAGHDVSLSLALDGAREEVADACASARHSEPFLWVPTRLYETDIPAEGW